MGNICCGQSSEDYKHGAWEGPNDDDADNLSDDNDDQYNSKAVDQERLILLHQSSRDSSSLPGRSKKTRLKRPSISSTPIEFSSSFSFTPPSFPKSDETAEFLMSILAHHFVFASIDEETKLQFVSAMQSQEFNEGDWVMRQGDVGDYFYIVEDGEVAFHVGGENAAGSGSASENHPQVGTGSKGSSFGELALLYNTPRAASIRALAPLKLFKIDQLTFRSLLMSQQVQDRSNIISLVEKRSIFEDLDEGRLCKLVDASTIVKFNEGERIVNKGDHGDIFYIIKSGSVKIDDIGHGSSKFEDQTMGVGDCFGERALITGETRAANVTAITECSLLAISKQVCENIIGPLEQAIRNSSRSKYLRSIPLFEYLEPREIDRCVLCLKEESFVKGDKILAKGKFHLIQEGSVLKILPNKEKEGKNEQDGSAGSLEKEGVMAGPKLVKLEKGDYFGELSCGGNEPNNNIEGEVDKIDEDLIVTVESNMKCLTLLRSDIKHVIGDLEHISKEHNIQEEQGNHKPIRSMASFLESQKKSPSLFKSRRTLTDRSVMNLSKLKRHRILGVGTFGKVWLVTPKSTKDTPTPYALKMVSKRQLLQQRLAVTVLREKNVMESIEHPLLMHMVSSFQDENYLYFVMDLILGGELFDLLYTNDNANTDSKAWQESGFYTSFGAKEEKPIRGLAGVGVRKALFYGACVIEGFAYLHNRHIAYRDLKPENVLLNDKGYCVIVDFGFAKVVMDKTYTMCGTPEYLAPEIIVNKGHNHAADYWSFACLLYELIVGQTPFFNANLDQMSLLKKITSAEYAFPGSLTQLSPDSSNSFDKALLHWSDLISCLLKPRASERIGNLCNGIEGILRHEWFNNVDFHDLRKQSIPAPWVPEIKDPMDSSHFGDSDPRQEQPERFKNKLSAKDQEIFKNF